MERAQPGVIVGIPQTRVKPGTVIADKYRVEKELGRGGFAIVVRAIHLAIEQVVAIKVLMPGEGGEVEWKEDAARFQREAQATAALKSEHVVRILDVDVLESGNPYMVMEYLEGETLHQTIHTRGPLSVPEVVDHMVQVLAALGEAHAAGIVHRDLKPANVFLTKGPGGTLVAKVLDFGVSKVGAQGGTGLVSAPITKTGAVVGTAVYMAPEQMADAKRVDARADLWSVGIMLFELLTNQTPFGPWNDPTLITSVLTRPPAPLTTLRPDAPRKLEAVIMRLLEKSPEKRFKTAAAVAAALSDLTTPRARAALDSLRLAKKPTGAAAPIEKGGPMVPGPPPAEPWSPGMLTIAIVAVVVTVAAVGVVIGVVISSR